MMRRKATYLAALAFVVVGCSTESPPDQSKASGEAAPLTATDVAAVKSEMDKYVSAMLAGDWAGYAQTLAPEVIAYPPNAEPISGREGVVAFIKAFPKITAFKVDIAEVSGLGDLAYATGKYHLTAQMPDGTAVNDEGSFMEIHQRQPDGSWPYKRLIWHTNLPLPTAPAKP